MDYGKPTVEGKFWKGVGWGSVLAALIWGGLFFLIIKLWADMPIVYKSASSDECVRVDDPAGEHDCGNLPDKYELVWVQ